MSSAFTGWWPLSAVGNQAATARTGAAPSPAADQLEDLDEILGEPGPNDDLPVSSSSGAELLHTLAEEQQLGVAPREREQQQHLHSGYHSSPPGSGTSVSSLSSSLLSISAWLPHLGTSGAPGAAGQPDEQHAQHQQQPPPQQQQQHQQQQAGWWGYLPASLGGVPLQAEADRSTGMTSGISAITGSAVAAVGGAASVAGSAVGSAVAALTSATSWTAAQAAAAPHQLATACDHLAGSAVGATALGAAVGGLVAGPLGVAVGAKSGAALVAAGALSGVAVRHVKDRHASPPADGAAGAVLGDTERELQPLGLAAIRQQPR